ncbi:MAG TPA: hypothetical protein VM890_12530 [Longimicrobium sp.]|jgi:hypothetical protein|nr:hypothetical protein [Longimicrobium sp.]
MPFACPECGSPGSLRITSSIELPPDSRSDEIALQLVACARCGFRAAAVYEESRRGGLDSEAVDHVGYRMTGEALDSLAARIGACPETRNRGCGCESHRRLGRTDDSGRWRGLEDSAGWFPMVYTADPALP